MNREEEFLEMFSNLDRLEKARLGIDKSIHRSHKIITFINIISLVVIITGTVFFYYCLFTHKPFPFFLVGIYVGYSIAKAITDVLRERSDWDDHLRIDRHIEETNKRIKADKREIKSALKLKKKELN